MKSLFRHFVMQFCHKPSLGVSFVRDPHVLDLWCVTCMSFFWGGLAVLMHLLGNFIFESFGALYRLGISGYHSHSDTFCGTLWGGYAIATWSWKLTYVPKFVILLTKGIVISQRDHFVGCLLKHFAPKVSHFLLFRCILLWISISLFGLSGFQVKEPVSSCIILIRDLRVSGSDFFFPYHRDIFPWHGCRIGEAKNPGPNSATSSYINVAIVNPTSMKGKIDTFASLEKNHGVKLFAISETSATENVQKQLTKELARKKLRVCWSPPVLPQRHLPSGFECQRGRASGTAVISTFPNQTLETAVA